MQLVEKYKKEDPRRIQEIIDKMPPESIPEWARSPRQSPGAPRAAAGLTKPSDLPRLDSIPDFRSATLPRVSDPTRTKPATLDPRWRNNPSVRNFVRFWEKNVGPLDKTPALKNALFELLNNSGGSNSNTGSIEGNAIDSLLDPESDIGREISKLLESAANGTNWQWSGLNLGDWKPNLPNAILPSNGASYSPPSFSGEGSTQPVGTFLLVLALFGLAILILRRSGLSKLLRGFTTKSISETQSDMDPNSITDRMSLVSAFESVTRLSLGCVAETWNHRTIAAELAQRSPAGLASEAAALYEVARYAPPSDSLDEETLSAARRCLVQLREAASR